MRAPPVAILLIVAGCVGGGAGDGSTSSTSSTSSTGSSTTATASTTLAELDCAGEPDALFNKRIAPLLATDRPSTCNTCHLSGVDLEIFLQDTPCQTMACLDARGLVDLEAPADSVVLQWIARADPASPLIDAAVIEEEYAAFLSWIEATAACGVCYTGDSPCGELVAEVCAEDPEAEPYADPGGCAPVTREALFRRDVYAWRDRCYPCHFDSTEFEAPKWIATGACELGSLMTMHNVLDPAHSLVNLADPAESLLLLKPLAEGAGGVMHGGHDKFAGADDPAYLDILAWIEREAACTP